MKLFPDLGLCICESMNKISLLVLFWYQEFARSDWMGLLGGDQTCQNNFPLDKIILCLCEFFCLKTLFEILFLIFFKNDLTDVRFKKVSHAGSLMTF